MQTEYGLILPDVIVRDALASLVVNTVLPRTVSRQLTGNDFAGAKGRTITYLSSVTISASARDYTQANFAAADSIVLDELVQTSTDVHVNKLAYSGVPLPDDFTTFDLQSLNAQVLRPLAVNVANKLVGDLIAKMVTIPTASGLSVTADGSNVHKVVTHAAMVLTSRGVPQGDRYLAVGTGIAEDLLNSPLLQQNDQSGSTDALRQATIGNLRGFTVLVEPRLDPNTALAYHSQAFAHITLPPVLPTGAAEAGIDRASGFALRYTMDYDFMTRRDRIALDTFYGAEIVSADSAVRITKATS